jgi:hypothetical protein
MDGFNSKRAPINEEEEVHEKFYTNGLTYSKNKRELKSKLNGIFRALLVACG